MGRSDRLFSASTVNPGHHHIPLGIKESEIHVWQARPSQLSPDALTRLQATLSEEERNRAAQFRFRADRLGFISSRGVLRNLLGRYLKMDPEAIVFSYGPWGKPGLAGGSDLHFNLSHSGDLFLIACAWERRVGVDVQIHRPDVEFDQIALRFFHPLEHRDLLGVPESDRPQAFFTCWARKEAFLKATGQGFSFPSDRFAVTCLPGEMAALIRHEEDETEVIRWTLSDLHVDPAASAAVAGEGTGWQIKLLHWQ